MCALVRQLWPLVVMLLLTTTRAEAQRGYWKMNLDTLAAGHKLHTHVEVRGKVAPYYPKTEDDGDRHIKLLSPSGAFIIVECIPLLPSPCAGVKTGQFLIVRGISRRDPEHGWMEVHPAESIVVGQ
jgi:hypothetical protein